eukprot:501139-Pelagomonas_calceolata.AAC.2
MRVCLGVCELPDSALLYASGVVPEDRVLSDVGVVEKGARGFVGRLLDEHGQPTRLSTEEMLLMQSLQRLDAHLLARGGGQAAGAAAGGPQCLDAHVLALGAWQAAAAAAAAAAAGLVWVSCTKVCMLKHKGDQGVVWGSVHGHFQCEGIACAIAWPCPFIAGWLCLLGYEL